MNDMQQGSDCGWNMIPVTGLSGCIKEINTYTYSSLNGWLDRPILGTSGTIKCSSTRCCDSDELIYTLLLIS